MDEKSRGWLRFRRFLEEIDHVDPIYFVFNHFRHAENVFGSCRRRRYCRRRRCR